jgi:hypothetical protein
MEMIGNSTVCTKNKIPQFRILRKWGNDKYNDNNLFLEKIDNNRNDYEKWQGISWNAQ